MSRLRVGSGLGAALEGVFLMDIQAAKEQCEAVTHHVGGWAWRRRADGSKFADGTPVCEVVAADRTIIAYDVGEPEARFIAAAHSDLPAALEALEEAVKRGVTVWHWAIPWKDAALEHEYRLGRAVEALEEAQGLAANLAQRLQEAKDRKVLLNGMTQEQKAAVFDIKAIVSDGVRHYADARTALAPGEEK